MTKKQITWIVLISLFNPITIFLASSIIQWWWSASENSSILVTSVISSFYLLMLVFIPLGIFLIIERKNTQGTEEKNNQSYGGFWKRMGSYWIDSFSFYLIIPIFISLFTYYSRGQTLWKMAMGIKIVRTDSRKKPSGFILFSRPITKIVSSIPLYLGFFWIGWDKKKQWWHDKICDTVIIETRSYSSAWTWVTNIPFFLTILGILATIAFTSFQGYSQKARDAQRHSVVNSLSIMTTMNESSGNTLPLNKEEVLTMIQSHGSAILAPKQEDRCYFYIVNPETNEFLYLVSWESLQENWAYRLYMGWNYPEFQNYYANGITPGTYFSCDMQEAWYINLSE